MDAITAYKAGATGAGITVGIVDSGIDIQSSEFTGRIHTASRDVVSTRGIDDTSGHGTSVAGVIGAARNNAEILGVAFDSTLLVLRTDDPASCSGTNGCSHRDTDIAAAVDVAIANNARVINLSLGGDTPNSVLRDAFSRATAQGIVIVISAGNDANPDPNGFALIATDAAIARDQIIIAGSHDATGAISSFSNEAGSGQDFYLVSRGEAVRSFDHTGTPFLFSGTSYSAPQISGAVALLAQAFPNLTGSQIVDLLFASAIDRGATGTDAVYGRGQLSLTNAFAPQGATALAGSKTPVSLGTNGTLGGPLGDGAELGQGFGGAIILDGYSRAYALDLARTLNLAPRPSGLAARLSGHQSSTGFARGGTSVAVTIERSPTGPSEARIAAMRLSSEDAVQARATAMTVVRTLGRDSAVAFGFGRGSNGLSAQIAGESGPAFLIAEEGDALTAIEHRAGAAFALGHQAGRLGLSLSAEQGDVLAPVGRRWDRHGYGLVRTGAAGRFGLLTVRGGLALLNESDTFLGSSFGPAFGIAGAETLFLDVGGSLELGDRWTLAIAAREGRSRAHLAGGLVSAASGIRSRALSADLSATHVLAPGDRFGLRIAQPLRVDRGALSARLPDSYDYATGQAGFATRTVGLAPKGRELAVEAAYTTGFGPGSLSANAYWRREPGHVATAPNDLGLAVRFGLAF